MFADPKKVNARRLRRHLKAGAAVALAMVAGAFLACKGESNQVEPPSPSGPDARSGPGSRSTEDAGTIDATNDVADAADDVTNDAPNDAANDALAVTDGSADASTTLAVRDAGADAAAKTRRVDKHEHRKGMPVRDNLLE